MPSDPQTDYTGYITSGTCDVRGCGQASNGNRKLVVLRHKTGGIRQGFKFAMEVCPTHKALLSLPVLNPIDTGQGSNDEYQVVATIEEEP